MTLISWAKIFVTIFEVYFVAIGNIILFCYFSPDARQLNVKENE